MNDDELEQLLRRLSSEHVFAPSNPVEAARDLEEFENRFGIRLPRDLRSFYVKYQSADLFDGNFRLVPLQEIVPAGRALLGADDELPASWFAFCDHGGNGDWIGIDLLHASAQFPVLDLDHDDVQYAVIALSFAEFLNDVLSNGADFLYYANRGEQRYGKVEYSMSSQSILRSPMYQADWDRLGPEIGPEQCAFEGCVRSRIALSVFCRRHHFARLHGGRCPFEGDEDLPAVALYSKIFDGSF